MDVPTPNQNFEHAPLLQGIGAFLEALEVQGLHVDIDQRVRLHVLLLKLISYGSLPGDIDGLCRLITPILAGSPAQQATCESTFKSLWIKNSSPSPARLDGTRANTTETNNRNEKWSLAIWFGRWLMIVAGLLVVIALYFMVVGKHGSRQLTDNEGVIRSSETLTINLDWIKNYPVEEFEPAKQAPWNRTLRWYYTEYSVTKWTALLLPWAAYLGFVAFIYQRLLAFLRRNSLKHNLRSLSWHLDGKDTQFGDRLLIGELQPLRVLARYYQSIFDGERTAVASAEAAGRLQSRFKRVGVPVDFVILIDRQSRRDHLAAYGLALAKSLRNAGLSIEIFEFNGNIALCQDIREGRISKLDALVRRFSDSILLIFAAADQLVDPARDLLSPSVKALKDIRGVVLLKPEANRTETDLERALVRLLGISIFSATPDGVRELIHFLLSDGQKRPLEKQQHRAPSVDAALLNNWFLDRPGRWMQSISPPARDLRRLKNHLSSVLRPEVIRWLAATSIYPELRWRLTLSLKSATSDNRSISSLLDSELLAVSRMPWFRNGWMPDWTRNLLQRSLSENDRKRVRQRILEIMGVTGPRANVSGEVTRFSISGLRNEHEDSITSDNILLDFLLPGMPSTNRMFALPSTVLSGLIRKPLRRLAGALLVGALTTTALSAGALSLLPIDDCDLLAASDADNQRIGPATRYTVLRVFHSTAALNACGKAVAREPNNGRFHYQLARALSITDLKESYQESLRSAALNYPAGYNGIGFNFLEGEGVPVDLIKAEENFRIALRLGNTRSLLNLAAVAESRGDMLQRFELLTKYVDAGGPGTRDLALFYLEQPSIVPRNIQRYIELLELGLRRGDGASATRLGYIYESGLFGFKVDTKRALELYELGVRYNVDASAAANLAGRYREGGDGIKVDLERATYWAIFASRLGNSNGLEILAELMSSRQAKFRDNYGPPAPFDYNQLARKLAENGNVNQQLKLGREMESRGNLIEAIKWFRMAAGNDNKDAQDSLKRLLNGKKDRLLVPSGPSLP
jgi:TPR repeat protein